MIEKIPITVVTHKYDIWWYFKEIMWERMLNNDYKILISTIDKYKHLAERLIVDLKMWGWQLEELDKNPYEEIVKGENMPLTYIKYSLVLNPTLKAIMQEVMKEKKSRDILLYQLDNLNEDRKKNEETIREVMKEQKIKDFMSTFIDIYEKNKKE